ncbi:MAG: MFS transporter [Burkholderiales bacterium]|nr:MFS transporter [Burkholderiales bacterium]
MKTKYIFILMLLISFGSIGAVIFTPGLPDIATYFRVSSQIAEYTITWYLVGYAFGQLVYGALVNRFGSHLTIVIGTILAIIGTCGCILSYWIDSFILLVIARFIMALGCACGLKMTFTLAHKLFTHNDSARVMGLLTMAFAITPGFGVFIGGLAIQHFNWTAPFYLMIVYALAILLCANQLPEVITAKDYNALKIDNLLNNYLVQFKDSAVIFGGLLVGLGSCVVYIFASVSPFIAMNTMHLTPTSYGAYSFIPSLGILLGSVLSNYLGKVWTPNKSLKFGLFISILGTILLFLLLFISNNQAMSLFLPMVIIYFGLSFIFGNSAALALKYAEDKSNAAAVMSFINMGSAFLVVTILGLFNISQPIILPIVYLGLLGFGILWYVILTKLNQNNE